MSYSGVALPAACAAVLDEILLQCKLQSVRVTSVARTPADQARVMYENLQLPVPAASRQVYPDSVAWQRGLYKSPGKKVIETYVLAKAEGLGREATIHAMEQKINELGPATVSRHCAGEASPVWVFDVAPSSIPVALRGTFVAVARKHPRVLHFLEPPADPAYHLEISVHE